MNERIKVSQHLEIELIASTDRNNAALRLYTPTDPNQSFIVFLSELHLLRDALADAGSRLTELEKKRRKRED